MIGACSCLKDLRFSKKADEAAYKAMCELTLLRSASVACVVGLVVCLVPVSFTFFREIWREDDPFRWQVGDSRTLAYSATLGFVSMLLALLILLSLRQCFGLRRLWDWEAICLITFATSFAFYPFTYPAIASTMFGEDPVTVWAYSPDLQLSEKHMLLTMDVALTAVYLYVPVRVHTLWIVPVCLLSTFAAYLFAVGFPNPISHASNFSMLVPLLLFSYQGRRRDEQHSRERWIAIQGLEESKVRETEQSSLARGMQSVAEILFDFVVTLGEDSRVLGSNKRRDLHFGTGLEGRLFADVVSASDQDRFDVCLSQASSLHSPQSVPVMLEPRGGPRAAQLLIVDTGRQHPRWLVGVRLDETPTLPSSSDSSVDQHHSVPVLTGCSAESNSNSYGEMSGSDASTPDLVRRLAVMALLGCSPPTVQSESTHGSNSSCSRL